MARIPAFTVYMNPIVRALKELGGSATNPELYERVTTIMGLTEKELSVAHGDSANLTEVGYRMAWARTYLKNAGFLENSQRGVWTLARAGQEVLSVLSVTSVAPFSVVAVGKP